MCEPVLMSYVCVHYDYNVWNKDLGAGFVGKQQFFSDILQPATALCSSLCSFQ